MRALILGSSFILALASAAIADPVLTEGRAMMERIRKDVPLIADRNTPVRIDDYGLAVSVAREVRMSNPWLTAEARRQRIISRSPGVAVAEESYLRCVVSRALIYGAATAENAASVAEAATANCIEERDELLRSVRFAAWGAEDISITFVDSPRFASIAQTRVQRLDAVVVKILSARVVHLRASMAMRGRDSLNIQQVGNEPAESLPKAAITPIEREISRVVSEIAVRRIADR